MSAADSEIGLSSCLEALGGDKEHCDPPGVAHEKASTFALLGRDAGSPYPLAHCLDLLELVEHHRPVVQTNPTDRAKNGVKRSILLEATLDAIVVERPEPT